MSNAARWETRLAALSLALVACGIPEISPAATIQLIRAQCGYSMRSHLPCADPMEVHQTSPEFFTVWADSAWRDWTDGCFGDSSSTMHPWAMQTTKVRADSIYFHETVSLQGYGYPQPSVSESHGSVLFRVPEGQQFPYTFGGTVYLWDDGFRGTSASASITLSRVDPWGTTVLQTASYLDSLSGGIPPTEMIRALGFHGTLTPGDYLYEAHLQVRTPWKGGEPNAELWLRFYRWPLETAVEPASWGRVKTLYR
jgi:hypothetical protein